MADPQRPTASTFAIREAREDDWPQIWPIIHEVSTDQRTFAHDPAASEDDAKRVWLLPAPARVVVAADGDLILGTANMYPNRPGPGQVASGSLMVAKQARGKGVGRALTADMISWARRSGFAAIQYNAVVDTNIREAREDDWPQIWPIIHDVSTEQQTFPYDPAMSEDDARRVWLLPAPARVVVAADGDLILGTANMYASRPGPGSHAASGSLMVAKQARRKGVGRALTADMISWARRTGFAAIQYNAVVDTNTTAIRLYESLGFVTLGTVPGAFRHPILGPVGLRIMWLDLRR